MWVARPPPAMAAITAVDSVQARLVRGSTCWGARGILPYPYRARLRTSAYSPAGCNARGGCRATPVGYVYHVEEAGDPT